MNNHINIYKDVSLINKKSKAAFKIISLSNSNDRNLAILNTAEIIKTNINNILAANEIDINNAKDKNLNNAFIDRLMLNADRINKIILGLINISKMDDPLGCELARWK